jgi:HSP20 family protein
MLVRTFNPRPFAPVPNPAELFNSVFSLGSAAPAGPALNVWETAEAFIVETELPGVSMESLDLSVIGADLTIKGERTAQSPDQARFLRRERRGGRFERTITLPAEVDAEKVDAALVNGVLTINLPKAPAARPRKIAVSARQS